MVLIDKANVALLVHSTRSVPSMSLARLHYGPLRSRHVCTYVPTYLPTWYSSTRICSCLLTMLSTDIQPLLPCIFHQPRQTRSIETVLHPLHLRNPPSLTPGPLWADEAGGHDSPGLSDTQGLDDDEIDACSSMRHSSTYLRPVLFLQP